MRLLIVGTLHGQLTTATKIAMDKGATVTHAADIAIFTALASCPFSRPTTSNRMTLLP